MGVKSIQSRFAATLVANALRSLLNFATGLVVARSMGPERYGDVVFLLGSFEAIRQAVSMGTSNAFFTFISRNGRGPRFVWAYWVWQCIQLILTLMAIGVLMPSTWFNAIWLNQDRTIVVLACVAVFCQSQAWQTAMQIAEAKRQTIRAQTINVAIAVTHFLFVAVAAWLGGLAIKFLLFLIISEYLIALLAAYLLLPSDEPNGLGENDWQLRKWLREYAIYCAPLLLYSIGSFLYEFSDKWLLQRFGGAGQQGLYGVASQFSAACLLATTSMVRILWKEAAELHHNEDYAGLRRLYESTSRALYGFGAVMGGFLWPWSESIAVATLGENYRLAWIPLAILFLYPTHQSLGQVMQTLFLAMGNTVSYFWIGIAFMMTSIPLTYFVLAPGTAIVPGLELGATGMALKTLVLNAIFVNVYIWYLCRKLKWKMAFGYQVVVLAWSVAVGGIAYWLANSFHVTAALPLLARLVIGGVIYSIFQMGFLICFPNLLGVPASMLVKLRLRAA